MATPEARARRIYGRGDTVFALPTSDDPDGSPSALVDETGSVWQVTETGLLDEADRADVLSRIGPHILPVGLVPVSR